MDYENKGGVGDLRRQDIEFIRDNLTYFGDKTYFPTLTLAALCNMALGKWNAECERDQERERAEEAEREVEKFRAMVKHLKYERDRVRQAWDRAEAEIENWRGCYETKKSKIRTLEDKIQELKRTLESEQVNSALLYRKLKKSENKG